MKKLTVLFSLLLALGLQSCKNDKSKQTENAALDVADENDSLKKNTETNASLLFDIEGDYKFKDVAAGCTLDLKLYYGKGILKYILITDTRKINENATIKLNEQKDGYYITLQNIKWSENDGSLNDQGELIEKNITLPKEIEGTLNKNEITIQNEGNSMNSYMKIAECGLKYIKLIKEENSIK